MFAFKYSKGLNLQRSFPIPAEQNPANLQPTARNGKERLHHGEADLLQQLGGILDSKGTRIQDVKPVSILKKKSKFAHSPTDSVVLGPQIGLIIGLVPKFKEIESRLERTDQQLRLFQKISRLMVREMSLPEVLQGIVSLIVEFMECDSCLVYLLQDSELVLCASNTPHPSTIGKVRLRLNEGLTGWVARERRLLAISRDAYKDPRFKYFGDLPEDTFEAFLSAPVIARNRVVGVINVQHRNAHQHTGNEMEVLTTVGEQVGCLLVLARMDPTAVAAANHVELVLSSGPVQPLKR